jgi:hypothetical protein
MDTQTHPTNMIGEIVCQSLPRRIQCGDGTSTRDISPSLSFVCNRCSNSRCSFRSFQLQQLVKENDGIIICYEILTTESEVRYIYHFLQSDGDDNSTLSLSLGNYYYFENFKLFHPCRCFSSLSLHLPSDDDDHLVYLYGSISLASSIAFASSSSSSHLIHMAENISINHSKYFRPLSISQKDEYSHHPIHLQGIVCRAYQSFNQIFWIEILNKTKYIKGESFFIYFPCDRHHSLSQINFSKFLVGDSIIFYSVYPIYLWGRLHGFAMTARSWFMTQRISQSFFPSISLHHTSSTPTSTQTEKQFISLKDLHLTSSLHNLLNRNCSLFLAWSAYVNRRIKQCVSSSSTCHYHSPDYGRLLTLFIFKLNLLLELFQIPNQITFSNEFIQKDTGPFFMIRAGQDLDYLCNQLPEVRLTSLFLLFSAPPNQFSYHPSLS